MDSFPGLLMDSLPLATFKWKTQSKSTQVTSGKSTQRDFRFCQSFGDHTSKNLSLHLRYLQRLPGLSPSLDLNTHSHIKKVDLYVGSGCTLSCLCRHTWRSLENKGCISEKSREGYNQQGWWLRGSPDHWRCKWLLQVGAAGWMLDAPGWRWRRKLCLTTPWQVSPSKTQLLRLTMGPGNFSRAVYFPLACRQF